MWQKAQEAQSWWLMPVFLATQDAEIRSIMVQSQPREILCETLSQKKSQKKAGGLAQGVGPEFKPQLHQKKKKKTKRNTGSCYELRPASSRQSNKVYRMQGNGLCPSSEQVQAFPT
jgi:hypothetical protein